MSSDAPKYPAPSKEDEEAGEGEGEEEAAVAAASVIVNIAELARDPLAAEKVVEAPIAADQEETTHTPQPQTSTNEEDNNPSQEITETKEDEEDTTGKDENGVQESMQLGKATEDEEGAGKTEQEDEKDDVKSKDPENGMPPLHIEPEDVQIVIDGDTWACKSCTYVQSVSFLSCQMCGAGRDALERWACSVCTFVQDNSFGRCELCNSPRPKDDEISPGPHTSLTGNVDSVAGGNLPSSGPSLIQQISDPIISFVKKFSSEKVGKIMKGEEKDFFCGICLENIPIDNKADLCCPHSYCKECMEGFITFEIKEARVLNITCPGISEATGESCTAPFSQRDIKEIVDEETYAKYERFKELKHGNTVECPKCNQLQKGSRFKPAMTCNRPECGAEFCFIHSGAHVGMTCKQYAKKNRKDFRENRKYMAKKAIKCANPCCRVPIVKSEGCNHMTCSRCGMEFCYLCGGPTLDGLHYKDWNCILGCPDGQFTGEDVPNRRGTCGLKTCRAILWPIVYILGWIMWLLGIVMVILLWVFQLVGSILCCPCLCHRLNEIDCEENCCCGCSMCQGLFEMMFEVGCCRCSCCCYCCKVRS